MQITERRSSEIESRLRPLSMYYMTEEQLLQ